jgi:hypothetical protein
VGDDLTGHTSGARRTLPQHCKRFQVRMVDVSKISAIAML